MNEYYKIILTQGSINSGYLTVDKNYFPKDTWGDAKNKGNEFKLIISASEVHYTYYDLPHRFIHKRFLKFFADNYFQDGDELYLYKITDYEYELMPTKINPIEDTVKNDVISMQDEENVGIEGGKKSRYVNYYERNVKNRIKAIQIHGTQCKVCGFDFFDVYGDRGNNYIEVHHIKPVSDMDEKQTINIEEDMTVLCSNCHRMIHREKQNVLTVETLQKIIKEKNNL